MSRAKELAKVVTRYRVLSAENYVRIRTLAEAIRDGFCAYLGSEGPPCVLLAPPVGPFEPRDYADAAFSAPPAGFQPLAPIAFGLIVRVTPQGDWLRVVMRCAKEGETFRLSIAQGLDYSFKLPLAAGAPQDFLEALYVHLRDYFQQAIDSYEQGEYGEHLIGFDVIRRPDTVSETPVAST
ncbi:MAG: hypothetical protein ABWZ40_05745 [Caulobacterales bacterium]